MLREVELLEAKLRRRDVLVGRRISICILRCSYSGRHLQRAPLREMAPASGGTQRRRAVHEPGGGDASGPVAAADQFPTVIELPDLGGLRLPLQYHHEPGHEADGVTVTIPIAALGQVPAERLDWLVPGWLEEKIAALIKTLPKELRVQFIPAPDTAKAVTPALRFGEGDLIASLAWQLGRRTEVHVPRDAWQPEALPDWLRMNVRVVDESGK